MRKVPSVLGSLCCGLVMGLAGCLATATAPPHLTKEAFSFVQWTIRDYRTERGLIRHRTEGWISNIGLLTGSQIYRVKGDFSSRDQSVQYECRTRANEITSVAERLPNATYGCFAKEVDPSFVLAFDDQCASGILETRGARYKLERWWHDRYNFQEGFFVLDASDKIRAALSWSFGPAQYNGVYVDPSLSPKERDYMAIARGALLAMREGEDLGPICGTLRSYMDRF